MGLAVASGLVFVWAARLGVTWRSWVGVAGSLAVIVFMLVSGVPHPENWVRGRTREVGAAAFVGTELKKYRENAARRAIEEQFAGTWIAQDGTSANFGPDRATIGAEVLAPEYGPAGDDTVFDVDVRGLASVRGSSQEHTFVCVILANGEMLVSTGSPFSRDDRVMRFKRASSAAASNK
jgi:hypothetical protein